MLIKAFVRESHTRRKSTSGAPSFAIAHTVNFALEVVPLLAQLTIIYIYIYKYTIYTYNHVFTHAEDRLQTDYRQTD